MTQKENLLLHLAVAVGYARHALKTAGGGSFGECAAFSKAHLDLPDFAELSKANAMLRNT